MAPVIMTMTVETVISAEREGRQRKNVIHWWTPAGAPSQADLRALNIHVRDNITDKYAEATCAGTTFVSIKSTDVSTATGAQDELQMNRATIGGAQVLPGQVSLCFTKRTAVRGKSTRGRMFTFDVPEDHFNGDILNPGYLPLLTTLAGRFLTPAVGGLFVPAVGSRKNGNSVVMTAITWDQVADTQRRRLTGRGR